MKLYLKFLIFIVVLACAGPFLLKRSDGRPWMTASDLKAPDLAMPDTSPLTDEIEKLSDPAPEDAASDHTTVYKWQDENGGWHFSNRADPTHPGEAVKINTNTNTVQMPTPEKHTVDPRPYHSRNIITRETTALDTDASPYGQLPNLINKAKNVGNLLDQHQQQQERILREIDN